MVPIQSELKGAQWSDMNEKLLCNNFGMAECSPEMLSYCWNKQVCQYWCVTHVEECGYYIV